MPATKAKRIEPIVTEGSKINKVIEFDGKRYNLTLHMKLFTYPDFSFELIDYITNDKGNEVVGVWFWGTYGNNHVERLEFDTRKGDNYLNFHTSGTWCSGRKKNGRKRLVAIVEKESFPKI